MYSISSTYRFIALTMALLIFTSSVGFSIDMHYCQDELKSIAFFGKAKSCHEKIADTPEKKACPHHQKKVTVKKSCSVHQESKQVQKSCSMDEKHCCENKTLQFQADIDGEIHALYFTLATSLQYFALAYVNAFIANNSSITSKSTSYTYYQSPVIARDIHVLIESFLL